MQTRRVMIVVGIAALASAPFVIWGDAVTRTFVLLQAIGGVLVAIQLGRKRARSQ